MMSPPTDRQILRYGYVFYYCRQYEADWIQFCAALNILLMRPASTPPRSCQTTKISSLPFDTIFEIMSFCDSFTLCSSSVVCKTWNRAASRDIHWDKLGKRVFGVSIDGIRAAKGTTSKAIYKSLHCTFYGLLRGRKCLSINSAYIPRAVFDMIQ
jgi:hypothetical protein